MTCRRFTLVRRPVGMEHPVITQSLHDVALAGLGIGGPFYNKMIKFDNVYLLQQYSYSLVTSNSWSATCFALSEDTREREGIGGDREVVLMTSCDDKEL